MDTLRNSQRCQHNLEGIVYGTNCFCNMVIQSIGLNCNRPFCHGKSYTNRLIGDTHPALQCSNVGDKTL